MTVEMRCHKPYFQPESNFTFWAASGSLQKGSGDLKNGFCQKSFQDTKVPPKSADPAKFHGLKLKNMENMANSQRIKHKTTAPYAKQRTWSVMFWKPTRVLETMFFAAAGSHLAWWFLIWSLIVTPSKIHKDRTVACPVTLRGGDLAFLQKCKKKIFF